MRPFLVFGEEEALEYMNKFKMILGPEVGIGSLEAVAEIYGLDVQAFRNDLRMYFDRVDLEAIHRGEITAPRASMLIVETKGAFYEFSLYAPK